MKKSGQMTLTLWQRTAVNKKSRELKSSVSLPMASAAAAASTGDAGGVTDGNVVDSCPPELADAMVQSDAEEDDEDAAEDSGDDGVGGSPPPPHPTTVPVLPAIDVSDLLPDSGDEDEEEASVDAAEEPRAGTKRKNGPTGKAHRVYSTALFNQSELTSRPFLSLLSPFPSSLLCALRRQGASRPREPQLPLRLRGRGDHAGPARPRIHH